MSKREVREALKGASPRVRRIVGGALRRKPSDEQKRVTAEIVENLRAAMALRNVRPSDLAKRLGVGRSDVSKLLAGKQGLSIERLSEVAHALGMSLHVYFRTPARWKPMPTNPDQHGPQDYDDRD